MRRMILRFLYDQALFQYSEMENIGRSVALLLEHAEGCPGALTGDDWRDLLGVTLEEFMRIGFAMHVAAARNGGRISRDLLKAEHVAPIFTPLTAEEALAVIDRLYAGTIPELKAMGQAAEVTGMEKCSFNPLLAKPIVTIRDQYVMPIPRYLIERFSPSGLYFIALAKHGSRFTDALGCMFECYVGTQLELIAAWVVHPEIVYGPHGEKTVDYFVVCDTCVLLVEVKAARPIEATRFGDEGSENDIESKVGHAIDQVNRSADLLLTEPLLAHINPEELPVLGLVVTLEPFLLANTDLYNGVLTAPKIPTIIASAHELEGFIANLIGHPDPTRFLTAAYEPPDGQPKSLPKAVEDLERQANPILSAAWDRFMKPVDDLHHTRQESTRDEERSGST
jgi:hypothetical protein